MVSPSVESMERTCRFGVSILYASPMYGLSDTSSGSPAHIEGEGSGLGISHERVGRARRRGQRADAARDVDAAHHDFIRVDVVDVEGVGDRHHAGLETPPAMPTWTMPCVNTEPLVAS